MGNVSDHGGPGLDWERIATRFDGYAFDEASKLCPETRQTVRSNRDRMMARAFRPIMSLIRGATRIADIGCGAGDLLLFLRSRTSASLVGFDPSASQIETTKCRLGGAAGVGLLSDPAALRGTFDLVFSLHVIEHVPDPDLGNFAAFMANLISPSGKLVIATPNGLNPLSYAFNMSFDRTHVRMHSAFTLSELFRPLGLEVEQVHREIPQVYDFPTFAKTVVWWCMSLALKLGVYATAGGVRGLRFPLSMAPSLYYVIGRSGTAPGK